MSISMLTRVRYHRTVPGNIFPERLEGRQLFCGAGDAGLHVNAGGAPVLDATLNSWQADTGFTGGAVSTSPYHVAGTNEQELYSSRRWGNFDFTTDADDGRYTLTLLFADPVTTRPGQRVFNVFAQGQPLLNHFDIVSAAGPQTAITRSFPININDGSLHLHFEGVIGNAIVSGISLVPLPIVPKAPTDLTAIADSQSHISLSWTDRANNESGFEVYRSGDGLTRWQNIGATGVDAESFIDTTATGGSTFYYRVCAVGDHGVSGYTDIAKVNSPPPPAPQMLGAPQIAVATAGSTLLRVNVGGSLYEDTARDVWTGDTGSSGGVVPTTSYPVSGSADPSLFSSRRWGDFSYNLPADDGNYTLRLYFFDPTMTGTNQRLFNVTAEGRQILTNFDLFAASGGYRKALVKSFPVSVSGGELNLVFKSIKDHAIVSAIELDPLDAQPAAPAAPSNLIAVAANNRIDLSWSDNSNNEAGFELERQRPGDAGFIRIATLPSNVTSFSDQNLPAGAMYSYRVRAINNAGDSGYGGPVNSSTTSPSTNNFTKITWTTVAPSPVPRTEAETAVVNGKLYVFGGYVDSTLIPNARADVYDPATNQWTRIADMPIGETHAGTCTDGRYIYMAGGYSGPGGAGKQTFARTDVFRYDTLTNTWSSLTSLPQARGAGGLVLLGHTLHFFGGTDLARQDRGEHWTLDLDNPTAWQSGASLPTLRNHMGAVVLNGKIYAIGGQQHQDAAEIAESAVQVWDPANPGVWTTAASLPLARSHIAGATFVMDGRIIVLGGETTYLHSVANDSAYDPAINKWTDLSPLPIARSSGCANVINGVLYYATGNIGKTVYKGVPS